MDDMDNKYNKFYEKAIEQDGTGDIVEVIGYLQEAAKLTIANGNRPSGSFACLALFYRVTKMMRYPDEDDMEAAREECEMLLNPLRGGR
jgi:hypothetical protein